MAPRLGAATPRAGPLICMLTSPRSGGAFSCYLSVQRTLQLRQNARDESPNANTPNVMPVTAMKVYFMSKIAARATMILVMACSIDTRSKA